MLGHPACGDRSMDMTTNTSPIADDTDQGLADSYAANQTFETPGIKPMGRPSFTTRSVMRVVSWIERLNLRSARFGNPPDLRPRHLPLGAGDRTGVAAHPHRTRPRAYPQGRPPELPRHLHRRLDHQHRRRLEDVLPDGLRPHLSQQHRAVPGNVAHRAENPRSADGDVLDLRAGQAFAGASRAL